jgi:hypothetical protein
MKETIIIQMVVAVAAARVVREEAATIVSII